MKIAALSPDRTNDRASALTVADAGFALDARFSHVLGLEVPNELAERDALAARCMELLRAWVPLLDRNAQGTRGPNALSLGAMPEESYPWPDSQHPDRCPVSSHNELVIASPADSVWAWLVRAKRWPEFYKNARRVEIEGGAEELTSGVTFRWTTFNLRVTTTVREFEPSRRLAWFGAGYGSAGYHSWTLEPRGDHCRVVTEETQRGFLPSIGRLYIRGALHRNHQAWLEGLARMASSGEPRG